MNATCRPSGEKSARSPKRVSTSISGGSASSGLPGLRWAGGVAGSAPRAAATAIAVHSAAITAARFTTGSAMLAYGLCARLGWWPGTNMSFQVRPSFLCISSG